MKVDLTFHVYGFTGFRAWSLKIESKSDGCFQFLYAAKPTSRQIRDAKKQVGGLQFSAFKG